MFGPQGFVIFVVLIAAFAGALYWLVRTRRLALRIVAGVLAFPPAVLFGIALVNKFYGYYQSWDDTWRDLTDRAPAGVAAVPDLGMRMDKVLAEAVHERQARENGFAMETALSGRLSHIDREGMMYLPPQYFQPRYAHRRFPVLELLHGSPGTPGDFEGRLDTSETLRKLIDTHKAKPAVLVIPDTSGGLDRSTQCLNVAGGEQDETYLTQDVPDLVAARLRVARPGPGWGIAGFSEGGYCAANLALRHPDRYGLAASLSGYYAPLPNDQLPQRVDPFGGSAKVRAANTPLSILAKPLPSNRVPRFWLMTGDAARPDLTQAQAFANLVRRYQPDVPFVVVRGGGHDYESWRRAMPVMLEWATPWLWNVYG